MLGVPVPVITLTLVLQIIIYSSSEFQQELSSIFLNDVTQFFFKLLTPAPLNLQSVTTAAVSRAVDGHQTAAAADGDII